MFGEINIIFRKKNPLFNFWTRDLYVCVLSFITVLEPQLLLELLLVLQAEL